MEGSKAKGASQREESELSHQNTLLYFPGTPKERGNWKKWHKGATAIGLAATLRVHDVILLSVSCPKKKARKRGREADCRTQHHCITISQAMFISIPCPKHCSGVHATRLIYLHPTAVKSHRWDILAPIGPAPAKRLFATKPNKKVKLTRGPCPSESPSDTMPDIPNRGATE